MAAMAKKKKQAKKHSFKYIDPTAASVVASAGATQTATTEGAAAAPGKPRREVAVTTRDFSYVNSDLRRIGVLAASLVALEVVLWLLFTHSGVGNSVYSWFKV